MTALNFFSRFPHGGSIAGPTGPSGHIDSARKMKAFFNWVLVQQLQCLLNQIMPQVQSTCTKKSGWSILSIVVCLRFDVVHHLELVISRGYSQFWLIYNCYYVIYHKWITCSLTGTGKIEKHFSSTAFEVSCSDSRDPSWILDCIKVITPDKRVKVEHPSLAPFKTIW